MLAHIRAPQTPALCNAMMIACNILKACSSLQKTDTQLGVVIHNAAKGAEFAFLIERAYIITWPVNSRLRSREYIASTVCIFVPYVTVTAVAIA